MATNSLEIDGSIVTIDGGTVEFGPFNHASVSQLASFAITTEPAGQINLSQLAVIGVSLEQPPRPSMSQFAFLIITKDKTYTRQLKLQTVFSCNCWQPCNPVALIEGERK
jgi:hypothetical protein